MTPEEYKQIADVFTALLRDDPHWREMYDALNDVQKRFLMSFAGNIADRAAERVAP